MHKNTVRYDDNVQCITILYIWTTMYMACKISDFHLLKRLMPQFNSALAGVEERKIALQTYTVCYDDNVQYITYCT